MSRFAGSCDLFDLISTSGDFLKDYEEFKKATGGALHQRFKVEVTEYNRDYVKDHCRFFDYEEHAISVPDKRCKTGFREKIECSYKYMNKEFGSLKELNDFGVVIQKDIPFDSVYELIPFFPYAVASAYYGKDRLFVNISRESYVDRRFGSMMYESSDASCRTYRRELAEFAACVGEMINKRNRLKSIVESLSGGDDQELEKAISEEDGEMVRKLLAERNPDTVEVQFDRISEYWREENSRG